MGVLQVPVPNLMTKLMGYEQLLDYSALEQTDGTHITVPAGVYYHISAMTFTYLNITGVTNASNLFINDETPSTVWIAIFTADNTKYFVQHFTFPLPLRLDEGWTITGTGLGANEYQWLSVYGYIERKDS